jgi:hypothetical protein
LKKSLFAILLLAATPIIAQATTSTPPTVVKPATDPATQSLPFQLTKGIQIDDVHLKPVGDFEAYVDVPGKGGCQLTGQVKVVGMSAQGAGVQFDLENGGELKCGTDAPRKIDAHLAEEGTLANWLPPQVNLCARWDGTAVENHPKCLQRSVSAYWLDTGVVQVKGL